MLSQFAGEEEVLFPPCTLLKVKLRPAEKVESKSSSAISPELLREALAAGPADTRYARGLNPVPQEVASVAPATDRTWERIYAEDERAVEVTATGPVVRFDPRRAHWQ